MKYAYWDRFCDVFNGCWRVGAPCNNCWAVGNVWRFSQNPNETLFARYTGLVERCMDGEGTYLEWTGKTSVDFEPLEKLARVRKPQVVAFSWRGDWQHEKFSDKQIGEACWYMRESCDHHTFLTLTKRPERLKDNFSCYPTPNIWLGVSAWDQVSHDNACKYLAPLKKMGWHTWISLEPMIEFVDVFKNKFRPDWIVVGAETGKGARRIDSSFVMDVWDSCEKLNIPCFVKQFSEPANIGEYYRQLPPALAVKGE
jgi:protein gp37